MRISMSNTIFTSRDYLRCLLMAGAAVLILMSLSLTVISADNPKLPSMITMYKGESRVINGLGTKRMSVGDTSIVSSTLLESGEIVLIADSAGETNLQLWFVGGNRITIPLYVVERNAWRESLEVKELLKNVKGLNVRVVGNRIVVDGTVDTSDLERVNIVKERYDDILVLAREVTDFEQKMLYFDVQITEVSNSVTENIGVDWSTSFAGPTLAYENIWNAKSLGNFPPAAENGSALVQTVLGAATNPVDLVLGQQLNGATDIAGQRQLINAQQRAYTYWGIGTKVQSTINLLEKNGAAITLAKPRLSSRSGGKAVLTVGGQIPVITSSVSGQSVEYKDYGVILSVEPTIDLQNNITANIAVEVSAVDLANSVGNQPAFAKRRTENHVRLSPGETLALAGIIDKKEQLAYNGIKLLSDIPVFGNLFRSKAFEDGGSELVILITPKEISDPSQGINSELVQRAGDLVKDFEKSKRKLSNLGSKKED